MQLYNLQISLKFVLISLNIREITIRSGRREFSFIWGAGDIDYAIRKDEPPTLNNTSTAADITLYERWE